MAFTRLGSLYPIVENNSRLGLLVGVSTGGRYRLPSGDIVWRVDDRPFRELKAIDNPSPAGASAPTDSAPGDKAMQDTMSLAMRYAATAASTSTVASGDRARDMLAEMVAGKGLIFRAATAAPAYGLPSATVGRVGQVTERGLRPIPLDDSLKEGLAACGISADGPTPAKSGH
jgi:hypothetical protein